MMLVGLAALHRSFRSERTVTNNPGASPLSPVQQFLFSAASRQIVLLKDDRHVPPMSLLNDSKGSEERGNISQIP
jgi:hypothetical protein